MNKLLVATSNEGKVREIRDNLESFGIEVFSLKQAGLDISVEEDAPDFAGNAVKKGRVAATVSGSYALADDSGLEVDVLGGRPGVHSARYGGPGLNDLGRMERLLEELSGVPTEQRAARFCAVLAFVRPSGESVLFSGEVRGHIALAPAGSSGFGYDPIFVPNGFTKTFGQLGKEIKSRISHRADALNQFVNWIAQQGPSDCFTKSS